MDHVVAPSGRIVRLAAHASEESGEPRDRGGWHTVATGHAVRRNCQGMVVEEYFDPAAAARLRESTRVIEL